MSSESIDNMISSEELQQMCQKLSAEPFKKVKMRLGGNCLLILKFSDSIYGLIRYDGWRRLYILSK